LLLPVAVEVAATVLAVAVLVDTETRMRQNRPVAVALPKHR
jgi:hypothetical protein